LKINKINSTMIFNTSADKISLLIRHGDRDKIPVGSFGNEIMLNEQGIINSTRLVESLRDKQINKIYSSPVGRCVQTAECIAKGYGSQLDIIESKALGAPGLHINDEEIAGKYFLENGLHKMYHRFINEFEIPGVTSVKAFHKEMTDFIVSNTSNEGLTLFISHDMLIAFYHYSIDKKIYTRDNWVKYLSGIELKNGIYEG